MANGVLTTADLFESTGYAQASALARALDRSGVRFFWGKDGPWTTIDLVNAAGGLKPASNDADSYPADIL